MQQFLITIALLFSGIIVGQNSEKTSLEASNSITVSVVNALNDNGFVNFALFNKENFRKLPVKASSSNIINGKSTTVFNNVPDGNYAIICYHDENENKRLDFETNGMPKENYGTSNNPLNFGPPEFESSKFELTNENLILEIKF
ncbi:DUF2141 domain-containing protein [Lutibacter citreus]|uniref:DUF2141 domain-containing protein n=1 Tax=Lutibacter citreus TaxID=2138210 RepID=UPI000DBEAA45|nr:DUF2141 domain-containing protein [Lutibacter citreus]